MSDYATIKSTLRRAGELVDAGQVREADELVRGLAAVSAADVQANMSDAQIAALRKYRQATKGGAA